MPFHLRKIIKNIILKLHKSYELNKYDDFSIAEYFRKQGARIGRDNRLKIRSLGPEPYLVSIGNHCTIASNVAFNTHDGATWVFTEEHPRLQKFGPIKSRDNCFIGMSSIILPNVTIGPNSIIGAGSVVTKDVPPGVVAAGNPAKRISTIDEYKKKVLKIWDQQAPSDYLLSLQDGGKYSPEDIFVNKFRETHILREHLIRFFGGE